MTESLPSELTEILQTLPKDWKFESLEFWNMGWVADLSMKKRKFQLISDRGYIDVYEVINGQRQHILPPDEQWRSITPAQVCTLLINNAA